MISQPELFPVTKPAELKYRLFAGIFPDAEASARLREHQNALPEKPGFTGRPRPWRNLHVTLHHVGDYEEIPESVLEDSRAACAEAASKCGGGSFDVCFDRLDAFKGRSGNLPIILKQSRENPALHALHRSLVESLMRRHLAKPGNLKRFVPHLTLFYGDCDVPAQPVTPAVEWTVCEVVLIRSFLGQSRYESEGRWPLR